MEQIFQLILNHDLNAIKQLLNQNQSSVHIRSSQHDAQGMIESGLLPISDPAKVKHFINTTPLHLTVYLNQLDICQVLLEHNADIDNKDDFHYTPLIYAAYCDHQEILECLIEHVSHTSLQDLTGRTALHWAARNGHLNCVKRLNQSEPTTLSVRDQNNKTALDLAAHQNHQDVIHYFNQIRTSTS